MDGSSGAVIGYEAAAHPVYLIPGIQQLLFC
jgi:hypothetical protein